MDRDKNYQGTSLYDLPVHVCSSIADLPWEGERPYIVCASSNHWLELEREHLKAGYEKWVDFVSTNDLSRYNYQIDIMGVCNLRCPSCPRGNYESQPSSGSMSPETFEAIVDHVLSESPATAQIALYNWGDPLLHPKLPEILEIMRSKGVFSILSSNLSIDRDLEPVVRAKPGWLRVSLSGYHQQTYGRTHRRGQIDLVKSNLYRLRYLIDKYRSDLVVEVNYHMYKSNLDDYEDMNRLCQELGFLFDPIVAFFMPVEKLLDYVEGISNEETKSTISNLLLPIEDVLKIAHNVQRDQCNLYSKQIIINWDSSVSICCVTFDPDKSIVHPNFLEATPDGIIAAKAGNTICNGCMKHGLHEYYWNLDPQRAREVVNREIQSTVGSTEKIAV